VIGEVWIVLEQSIIDIAVNEKRNHLCARGRVMGWHFEHFLLQVVKNRQLNELSGQVTEMWKKMCFVSYFD